MSTWPELRADCVHSRLQKSEEKLDRAVFRNGLFLSYYQNKTKQEQNKKNPKIIQSFKFHYHINYLLFLTN